MRRTCPEVLAGGWGGIAGKGVLVLLNEPDLLVSLMDSK
jgi:hypothetical protein